MSADREGDFIERLGRELGDAVERRAGRPPEAPRVIEPQPLIGICREPEHHWYFPVDRIGERCPEAGCEAPIAYYALLPADRERAVEDVARAIEDTRRLDPEERAREVLDVIAPGYLEEEGE